MAFLWLHCAHEEDRVIDLADLREAYDAGVAFIQMKSPYARVIPFESICDYKFVPIAEHENYQIIIGVGRLGGPTLMYYNGSKVVTKLRVPSDPI